MFILPSNQATYAVSKPVPVSLDFPRHTGTPSCLSFKIQRYQFLTAYPLPLHKLQNVVFKLVNS